MATDSRATRLVKSNVSQFLPDHVISDASAEVGHRFRDRKLGPVRTVLLLVLQLLAANASLAHARALGGYTFSVSALAQARARLPVALLERVLAWLVVQAAGPAGSGPRVLLIDAFNGYMPDTPALRHKYRRPRQRKSKSKAKAKAKAKSKAKPKSKAKRKPPRGCDYPQARTVAMFDLWSGMLLGQRDFPADRHESPMLRHVLSMARPGDVVVFDRGFVSYANLCLLRERGVEMVARLAKGLHAKRGTRRTQMARLGSGDALVRWTRPARRPGGTCPREWAALPDELPTLRQLTVTVKGKAGYRSRRLTLITSLSDPATHPSTMIIEWYRRRWEIEQDVRHMKQTMNLEFFRTKSPENVERELLLRAIAYNLVRLAMVRAAQLRGIDDPGRVSFADACRWLVLASAAGVPLLNLLINPLRKRTSRPRKVKYRGRNYRVLTTQPAPQSKVA